MIWDRAPALPETAAPRLHTGAADNKCARARWELRVARIDLVRGDQGLRRFMIMPQQILRIGAHFERGGIARIRFQYLLDRFERVARLLRNELRAGKRQQNRRSLVLWANSERPRERTSRKIEVLLSELLPPLIERNAAGILLPEEPEKQYGCRKHHCLLRKTAP
jgi:hypothetical protein